MGLFSRAPIQPRIVTDQGAHAAQSNPIARAWAAAVILGVLVGGLCFVILRAHNSVNPSVGAGDFGWALRSARDLLSGRDPYSYPPGPLAIPYPLPAAFAALPFAWLPDVWAASLFFAVSTTILAFAILRSGQEWRMAMLLSWNFVYALLWVQWTPLLSALWFLPAAVVLVLLKPNIAIPLAVARWLRWDTDRLPMRWIGLAAGVLAASLLLHPTWPKVWLEQTSSYQGIRPPLFVLPLGPFVLLALISWKDRRALLLILLALMPQRMVYDQLPLLLIATNRRELWFLIAGSWVSFAILWNSPGFQSVPGGWQNLVLATSYLPALGVLLWPNAVRLWEKTRRPHQPSSQAA